MNEDNDDQCQLRYRGCERDGEWYEDPYQADINNTPGVMILACGHCLAELARDI